MYDDEISIVLVYNVTIPTQSHTKGKRSRLASPSI